MENDGASLESGCDIRSYSHINCNPGRFSLARRFNVLPNSLSESLFAYIGGIFGGLLSLAGVYLTIKSALKTRKLDLEIEYRPLLSVGVVDSKDRSHHIGLELFVLTNSSLFNDSHLEWLGERLLIENLGRGEVAEFTVGQLSCSPISCPEGFNLNGREWKVCKLFDSIPRVIPMSRSIEIHLGIPTPIDGVTVKDFSLRLEYEVESSHVGFTPKKRTGTH